MNVGTNLLRSATGNVEQAMVVIDVNSSVVETLDSSPPNALTKAKKIKDLALQKAALAQSLLDGNAGDGFEKKADCDRYFFSVQYNPSEFSIIGEKGIDYYTDLEKKRGTRQVSVPRETGTNELTLSLIFDETVIADAFLSEGLLGLVSGNPTQTAKSIAGIASKRRSVKKYVDAFTACIGNNKVERVMFVWGSFMFVGMFSRLNVQYTMFDKFGNPIRANMHLTLKQTEGDLCWDTDIDKEFKATIGGKVGAKVESLFNLNL